MNFIKIKDLRINLNNVYYWKVTDNGKYGELYLIFDEEEVCIEFTSFDNRNILIQELDELCSMKTNKFPPCGFVKFMLNKLKKKMKEVKVND